jgi:opacity protein-like surface antigen
LLLVLIPGHAVADAVRGPYLGLRLGGQVLPDTDIASGLEATRLHSLYGVSIGLDVGRHLGFELAADFFEPDLRASARTRPGMGSIGELGTAILVPQVRLRYPVLDDRLVPYLVGGLGVSFTQFNNRKRDGFGRSIHAEDTALAWTVGGGLEYFVASNIAIGGEVRFAGLGGHDIEVDGHTRKANLDSVLFAAAARVYLRDGESARFDAEPPRRAPFLTVRMGGARVVNTTIARGIEARSDNSDLVPGMDNVLGFAVGMDLDRAVAVELAGEGYEMNLFLPGVGTIGEYAVVSFTPQLRLRYPLLAGRLLPSLLVGAGFTFTEFNDRKPPADTMDVRASDFSPAGVLGGGIEYLIARNIGVGVDVKYLISRGHMIRLDGTRQRANLDTVSVTAGLRLLFH